MGQRLILRALTAAELRSFVSVRLVSLFRPLQRDAVAVNGMYDTSAIIYVQMFTPKMVMHDFFFFLNSHNI